jgi:hypothetical protein
MFWTTQANHHSVQETVAPIQETVKQRLAYEKYSSKYGKDCNLLVMLQ